MTALSDPVDTPTEIVRDERSTTERIRTAALTSFATHGTAATTLRGVAESAGVSLGLVQHHFVNKAGLIKAVDDYVLNLLISTMSAPLSDPPVDSVAEIGDRIVVVLGGHPHVAAYVGRALVDGSPVGNTLFDTLVAVGLSRWHQRAEREETRPDIDLMWAAINGLVLALGAISLKPHLDRHLPQPLTTRAQLDRWQAATNMLMREGLFREPSGG